MSDSPRTTFAACHFCLSFRPLSSVPLSVCRFYVSTSTCFEIRPESSVSLLDCYCVYCSCLTLAYLQNQLPTGCRSCLLYERNGRSFGAVSYRVARGSVEEERMLFSVTPGSILRTDHSGNCRWKIKEGKIITKRRIK